MYKIFIRGHVDLVTIRYIELYVLVTLWYWYVMYVQLAALILQSIW